MILAIISTLFVCALGIPEYPVLRQICTAHFNTSYSCNGNYAQSGLFLSSQSQQQNMPDLLYNGACNSNAYFDVATAGADWGFMYTLGNVALTDIATIDAWRNQLLRPYSAVPVLGQSYVVFTNHGEITAVFAFKIVSWDAPTGPMDIEYTVFRYESWGYRNSSPGFTWDKYPIDGCTNDPGNTIPDLRTICRHYFDSRYGCGGNYNISALFLGNISIPLDAPQLLYYGECNDMPQFWVSTAGADWGVIYDFGEVNIRNITASNVWQNIKNYPYSATPIKGHTYAVFNVLSGITSTWVFTILGWDAPDGAMAIEWAVFYFDVFSLKGSSPGFDWNGYPQNVCA